ncbi:MAG: zinc metalloprotease HtpX [Acidobacteriota bacterium]|nr:zinc metalloprotease HtpX [Acidobacteriota bacterium]
MSHEVYRSNKLRNTLQTLLLLAAMAGLLGLLGYVFGGRIGVVMTTALGLGTLLFAPGLSPDLAMRLSGARKPAPWDLSRVRQMLADLAQKADLPKVPDLYIQPTAEVNAFAVGSPKRSAIALSAGLLQIMNQRELYGVLAHEMSHILHRDTRVLATAGSAANMARTLSLFGILLVILSLPLYFFTGEAIPWLGVLIMMATPTVAQLLQLALSRTRELDADLSAARLTGDPHGLASALARLERVSTSMWQRLFAIRRDPTPPWLRTHPDTKERIERLTAMKPRGASTPGTVPVRVLSRPYLTPSGWVIDVSSDRGKWRRAS